MGDKSVKVYKCERIKVTVFNLSPPYCLLMRIAGCRVALSFLIQNSKLLRCGI